MRVNEQQLSAKMWMDFTNLMSDRTSRTRRRVCWVVGLPHCRQNTGLPAGEKQSPDREDGRALGLVKGSALALHCCFRWFCQAVLVSGVTLLSMHNFGFVWKQSGPQTHGLWKQEDLVNQIMCPVVIATGFCLKVGFKDFWYLSNSISTAFDLCLPGHREGSD